MLALVLLTVLFAVAISAADVCPPGKAKFRIHPYNKPNLCLSTWPDFYIRWPYNDTTQLAWVGIELRECNGSATQIWEWFSDDKTLPGAILRNPNQNWPAETKPINPQGLVIQPFQYRFPTTIGSNYYALWFGSQSPWQRWKYTTDLQLINGFTVNGKETCMDGDVGPSLGPRVGVCDPNSNTQKWVFEYL